MPDKYGVIQDHYCYPDSSVLINKLSITDQSALDMAELEFTQYRVEQYEPDFDDFSWASLRRIHFLLFQAEMLGGGTCSKCSKFYRLKSLTFLEIWNLNRSKPLETIFAGTHYRLLRLNYDIYIG